MAGSFVAHPRGGAMLALPLFFCLGLPAALAADNRAFPAAAASSGGGDGSGMEASWLAFTLNHDQINEASTEAGFPGTSATALQMLGGGACIYKGQARYGVMGFTGALASDSGGRNSNWGLDLVGVLAEQRYPAGSWEALAGFFVGYGQFAAEFRDNAGYSRFESRFMASGATAGLHWPVESRLSFFLRSGYFWMPASGAWQGVLSGKMAKTYFDLSAPYAQLGMDLLF